MYQLKIFSLIAHSLFVFINLSQCALLEDFLKTLAKEMERHPIWSGTGIFLC